MIVSRPDVMNAGMAFPVDELVLIVKERQSPVAGQGPDLRTVISFTETGSSDFTG